MYCSSCGVAVTKGLNYCNYCGKRLNQDGDSSQVRPESLLFAMMATFIFGIGAITIFIGVMKTVLIIPVERILTIALLPFLLLVVLEAVFIRLLLQRTRIVEKKTDPTRADASTTNELDAAQARALPEPLPSVTEHTTRAFDPIYTERKQD